MNNGLFGENSANYSSLLLHFFYCFEIAGLVKSNLFL